MECGGKVILGYDTMYNSELIASEELYNHTIICSLTEN
jgi:hypothetical protein